MSFWSTQRVRVEQKQLGNLILPFHPERIRQGSYELSLSRDVLTGPPEKGPRLDGIGDVLEIPPGEFALLYTRETVRIPANVIAFISIKAGLKLDGLVNISGFHVDPGFSSRLKFSVYNAGNWPIYLPYEKEAFLIWFSDLDAPTEDPYGAPHQHFNQTGITPADRQRMSQRSYSPAALNERLQKIERRMGQIVAGGLIIVTGILVPLVLSWIEEHFGGKPQKTETVLSAPAGAKTSTPAVGPKP